MDNRFVGMQQHLKQVARPPGALRVTRGVPRAIARPQSVFAVPFAAADRSLVLLIENRGVDLGIPALIDKVLEVLPGAGIIPGSAKQALVNTVHDAIKKFTDNLLESAELTLNRYTAARPDFFGDVIVLRDGTATFSDLKATLVGQSRAGKIIDLIILTHGAEDSIDVDGHVNGEKIKAMKAELGRPLSIRAVYMMNCVGSSLNDAWLQAGARVSAGSIKNNYLPEPTTFFFWKAWKDGKSFEEAVTSAYRKTINLMNETVRGAVSALPIPGTSLLARQIDFSEMDFVKDSAPLVQGQQSLTINSDQLSGSQTLASGMATTVLPVNLLRMLGEPAAVMPALTRVPALSAEGLEFIKTWEGFRDKPGPDESGHCAVGYGTILHSGACDGRSVEEPYASGITRERASELLVQTCAEVRQLLEELVTTPLSQNQGDALISFVSDVGGEAFRSSTLLQRLNAGDLPGAAAEIRKWTKAEQNGAIVELPQLKKRREAEAELFERQVAVTQSLPQRRRRLARMFAAVDFAVDGVVPVVTQPTPRTCWAAVMTMMYSWRHKLSMPIRDVVAQIGATYADMFDHDRALDATTAPALYRDAGLSTITSFNPTPELWESMLKKYGPLYVDVGYPTGNMTHAIVMTAIRGDGTPDGTSVTYIDPSGGTTVTKKFGEFLAAYEAQSAVEWPHVVVHWPAGAQTSDQKSFTQSRDEFRSPSLVMAQSNYSMAQNPGVIIAGVTVGDALQIGLATAAVVQSQFPSSQGSFALTFDKAQRLLLPEARSQMPGAQRAKKSYSHLLFQLSVRGVNMANADVIAEWEGNAYGEIGTPMFRRRLSTSTEWSRSSAVITIAKVDRIPLPETDPRSWPIVYTYEGTYDPWANGYFEFSGEFELNAFGGLKFNRHEVVSRSMADWAVSGSPRDKVQRGPDVTVRVPEIPEEQVKYLKSRLP